MRPTIHFPAYFGVVDLARCTFELTFQLSTLHFLLLDDPLDPRLTDYRNIPDHELLLQRGIFVAEGRLVVRRLLMESRYCTRSVMVTAAARASLADVLDTRQDLPVFVVPPEVMNGITGFNIHRGCLAIGERPQALAWRDAVKEARTVIVLERVANADNVGGIFRNAAAFGADAVLLDETSTDPLYRKAIRTSMGAALLVPFARVTRCHEALPEMHDAGFATIALTPAASAPPLTATVEQIGRRPVALVFGHEGEGLTDESLAASQFQARIPIGSAVDSLNVAAAAAIALYEVTRRVV
jgi:tRNA G18 (ribose-2'-O)-methylase SpoU